MSPPGIKTEVLYRPPDDFVPSRTEGQPASGSGTTAVTTFTTPDNNSSSALPFVVPNAPSEYVATASLVTFFSHSRPVTHLSFSSVYPLHSDEKPEYNLLTSSKDSISYVLKGPTSDWIGTLSRHKGAVWQVRQYGNSDIVATASADMSAQIHDIYSGQLLASLPHNHVVKSVSFSTDPASTPTRLATGAMNKEVRIYDVSRAIQTAESSGEDAIPYTIVGRGEHKEMVRSVVWTGDPNILLSSADDRKLRWWDVRDRAEVPIHSVPVSSQVGSCEMDGGHHPSPGCVISVATDDEIVFFDPAVPGKVVKSFKPDDGVKMKSVAVSPMSATSSKRTIVTGMEDTTVRIWDWETGEVQHRALSYHHGPVWTVAFSPDGRQFATGSEDGTVRLWKCCEGPFGLWQ